MEVNQLKYFLTDELENDTTSKLADKRTDQLNETSCCGSVYGDSEKTFFEKLKWITTKEAAVYLRLSVGQIRNMVWRGQVKAYRISNRLRFLKSDLDQIMKSTNDRRNHD